MYLFNRKGNRVDVYTLTADVAKLKQYREEEMRKHIPYSEMLYRAVSNDEPILEQKDIVLPGDINFNKDGEYHFFGEDKDRPFREVCALMCNYFDGVYSNHHIAKLLDENGDVAKYLLLTQAYMCRYYPSFNMKHLDNIISIPKSLYLLQMLQQERFDLLQGEDIDKQLSMYTLSKGSIDHIYYNQKFGTDVIPECDLKLISESEEILRRVRRIK